MKEKIKFTVLGVLIGLLTSGTVAFAEKPIKILLDEKPIDGAEAIIYNDRTYVPVRVIADAFGFETFWDEENWQVKIKRNNKLGGKPTDLKKEGEVETPMEKDLPIEESLKGDVDTKMKEKYEIINDYPGDWNVKPIRYNGEIYLPLRDGAEKYGVFPVNFDSITKTVIFPNSNISVDITGEDVIIVNSRIMIRESIFIKAKENQKEGN